MAGYKMTKILIIDDEPNIIELARLYLEESGFGVISATSGTEGLARLAEFKPDFVILDLMLPDIDGFEVCRHIRSQSDIPILMLTARKEDVDKIVGLELGADDYSTKPFNPRELVARVKSILRRFKAGIRMGTPIEINNLIIDRNRHEVTIDGEPVKLRTKEFDLLDTLSRHLGLVLSREKLLELVWGFDYYGETRTVDVHVNHLREKLKKAAVSIETIRGTGYKMSPRVSKGR
jgi:DNA-binding response OmpR family regulator